VLPLLATLRIPKQAGGHLQIWVPIFLAWLVLFPILLLLSPLLLAVCLICLVNPVRALVQICEFLSALRTTHIEIGGGAGDAVVFHIL